MALTPGALSKIHVGENSATLLSAAAYGGVSPYSYQWYRGLTSDFTPGPENILTGKTSLQIVDTGLDPSHQYFYKVVSTDEGDGNAQATSLDLPVTTNPASQNQNQFSQTPLLGMPDLSNGVNNITAAQIDVSESGELVAGDKVKIVDSASGVPKVVKVTAASDNVWGVVVYNIRNRKYVAGDLCEVAQAGTCVWLQPTTAISRGAKVSSSLLSNGGVAELTSGANTVGYAFDKAVSPGELIRVVVSCPSFETYTP